MTNSLLITSDSGNEYFFSSKTKNFFFLPTGFKKYFNKEKSDNLNDYYARKYNFFRVHGVLTSENNHFSTNIHPENIKNHLANTRQLLIEVTDACNLACKYCGYGYLYGNFDKRTNKKQSFKNVRLLIDYLINMWNSSSNLSQKNLFSIGFYGGEPLLNFKLIKQTIEYIESLNSRCIEFVYNITTNGVLINKYADYLYEKKINILISLDGNKENNQYRVTKNGKNYFDRIVENIMNIKEKYPDYFNENVNFNAVLHNKNSFNEIYEYIYETFGKIPRIAELNTNGIIESKKQEFWMIFKSKYESNNHDLYINENTDLDVILNNPQITSFNQFIDAFCDNSFNSFNELFMEEDYFYVPTGTCQPFQRKIFLTVNGKILPCEKIGQEYPLGYVSEEVNIDYEKISEDYSKWYMQIVTQCQHCFLWKNCGQCIYFIDKQKGKLQCPQFFSEEMGQKYLSENISLSEEKRYLYEKLINEVLLD
jgi:uncharacterized protein